MRTMAAVFGFFTIIPLPRRATVTMEQVARGCYLLPLVAATAAVTAGLAAWGALEIWGVTVASALTLALLLLMTGLHHADGLADLGDAIMARGDSERRIGVLKDRTLGVGAVGAVVLVYLLTWAALIELLATVSGAAIIWYLLAAEVSARMALLLTAVASPSSHEGSGSLFIAAAKSGRGTAGIIISLAALAAVGVATRAAVPAAASVAGIIVAIAVTLTGRRIFGGVGGDLLGATVELGRMTALLGIVAALDGTPWS